MDWLSLYHAIHDFLVKTVTLEMPEFPKFEWRDSSIYLSSRVITSLTDRHMAEKGCLAYLSYVQDTAAETPTIDLVPMVRESSDVFLSDLPGMLLDCDNDFGIDLSPSTHPISITPCHIDLKDLKELKEHLEELLVKGFFRLRSPWGAPMLFVKIKYRSMLMCIDYL
ncbi:uncharacterized protein LOC142169534 [Nicotiana tabacum]|uniref:Uncharacterized protein LOC142169534 n=1 Tax=Nicotiana tabacum TaxID=4097 RepID=A0AC58SRB4_TOBAC